MRWGEQTSDEMAVVFLGIVLPAPEDVPVFQQEMAAEFRKANALSGPPANAPTVQQQVVMQFLESLFKDGATLQDLPRGIDARTTGCN